MQISSNRVLVSENNIIPMGGNSPALAALVGKVDLAFTFVWKES